MADLPRILAQPNLPTVNLPRVSAAAAGAPWAALSQAAADWGQALKEKQLPVDAALASSKYDILMADAKNETAADPDINNWRVNITKKQQEIQAEISSELTDPRAKQALILHANRTLGAHINDMTERAKVAAKEKQLTDLDRLGNSQALIAAKEDDPTLRASAFRIYESALASAETPVMVGGQVDPATGRKTGGQLIPATIKPDDAEKLRQAFPIKVLTNRMDMLALSPDPNDQEKLVKENMSGVYDTVPWGDRAKHLERGRSHQETLINKVEKDKNEVKQQVYQGAYALANFGMWPDASADRALRGDDPWISPEKARTLKHINDSPGSAEGSMAAKVVAQKYYLGGPRTKERIMATWKELNGVADAIGAPDKAVMKLGNELQSDWNAIETLDVAKQNNTIKAVHDSITADLPPLPFNMPLLNNIRKRDDAKAADDVRRGVDPEKVIKDAVRKGKTTAERLPEKEKKMNDALNRK